MPAPRKFDDQTRERAVRMYRDRRHEQPEEYQLQSRVHVGRLLDINPATLRNWVEREEVDAGERRGVTTEAAEELKALRKENAELRRANEILKTASAFFGAELDRPSR